MTQLDDYSQRLREYDEAFDFYMDNGQLPNNIPKDDMLGDFIGQTIDDNPQLSSQDPLWQELLKEEMMNFIEAMLQIFQPIEQRHRIEKALIDRYRNGDIDTQRAMWGQVVSVITSQYRQEEVNIEGYIQQFKDHDRETVLNALSKDWDKACDERTDALLKETLESNRAKWERHIKEYGRTDYKERIKVEQIFYSYPQLKDIVRIIGREQPKRDDEMDDTIQRYLPFLPSPPKPSVEIEEVSNGKDLQHLLPSETAIMADQQTENLFYLKYATYQLQLFANRPKHNSRFKTVQQQMKQPRLENGPIIVSVDTSGSMWGRPLQIAYAILRQLLRLAQKQKRKCYLITFAVRAQSLDLSLSRNRMRLKQFLEEKFTGGTDGEQMIQMALEMLQTKSYSMADVLIISDFEFPLPVKSTRKQMEDEHRKGTRFYGLRIDNTEKRYDTIMDKTWNIRRNVCQNF